VSVSGPELVSGKARVTAKQRRELKKQAQRGSGKTETGKTEETRADAQGSDDDETEAEPKPAGTDAEASKHATQPKHVRGKKGKKKKMQDKYAEQVCGMASRRS
jgi:hypothetical protein